MCKSITAALGGLLAAACFTIAKMADQARPDAPTIMPVFTSKGANTLRWDNVDGADTYKVYRNGEFHATLTTSTFYDAEPLPHSTYYVMAFDMTELHFSAKSNVVTAGSGTISLPDTDTDVAGDHSERHAS